MQIGAENAIGRVFDVFRCFHLIHDTLGRQRGRGKLPAALSTQLSLTITLNRGVSLAGAMLMSTLGMYADIA
jgi:hypothetical protein